MPRRALPAAPRARQFLGDRQAVGEVRPVRRLGLGQQVGHFLQLRLDPARTLVGQCTVPAGIGVDLGAVERHRAHLEHAHLARHRQHLDEQPLDLLGETVAGTLRSCRDPDLVRRDETEGYQVNSFARSSLRLENTPVA